MGWLDEIVVCFWVGLVVVVVVVGTVCLGGAGLGGSGAAGVLSVGGATGDTEKVNQRVTVLIPRYNSLYLNCHV